MFYLFSLVILFCLCYFLKLYIDEKNLIKKLEKSRIRQKKRNAAAKKRNEARRKKESAERKKAQQARRYQKKKREKEILNKFGNEVGNKIIKCEVWQGMTKEMLIESQGEPHDIKESVYKEKTNHKFYFRPRETRQNTIVYAYEVSLENDKVVGWRDLE